MNEQTELSQLAKTIYASAMAIMVAIGLLVNVGSIIILSRKRHKSMFHTLLKVLRDCQFSLPIIISIPLFKALAGPSCGSS